MRPRLTAEDLARFTGDLDRYAHTLNRRVIYTPGVRHVAEAGGACWLIDAIASYIGSAELHAATAEDERLAELHFWRLTVTEDDGATLTCRADADVPPAIVQAIPFTDFPLPVIAIWAAFDGRHWTLYLPSEH